MSVKRPDFTPGCYYHIFNRGANRQAIFKEKSNYLFVIQNLKKYANALSLSVIAYCLMPKHYHLLVRQDGDFPIGLLPQRVFNSYTKAYNQSYDHAGTLFESRFKIKLIDEDSYLVYLCKYIHLNPVKASLVAKPEEWIFSNYQEFIGMRQGKLFDQEFFDEYFDNTEDYFTFVNEESIDLKMPEGFKQYWGSL